jgi:hypothetical protein
MKTTRAGVALALLIAAALPACSDDKTYAVVTVRMNDGELANVGQFAVYVDNGDRHDVLFYPESPGGPWRLTPTDKVDFSVSFRSTYVGFLRVGVEPRDAVGNVLGYGVAEKMIDPGHRFDLDVAVILGARAPALGSNPDAGTADSVPVAKCQPTMPAACGAGQTCTVVCGGTEPAGVCTAAGLGKDGAACNSNRDCEPGTQCFAYGTCGKVCRKFCSGDGDCAGGRCDRTVSCGTQVTPHKYCSQSCDPTGEAVSTCQGGLKCLLFTGESVSCDCPEATRVKGDGEACTDTASCKPGFMCVNTGGSAGLVCRPMCKLADKVCPAGKTCTEVVSPKYVTYGACL